MDSSYAARYRDLFERHWWWRARERVILQTLRALQPPEGWPTILDVGCGDGLFFDELGRLPGARIVEGVESAAELVSPDGPHRRHIHLGPFDSGFRPGRRYSLILMLDVLEHLPDPVAALRHALSLLEPNGTLLVTVPAFMSLWTRHDDLNHHYTRYDKRSFDALAQQAGLHVERSRYFFHWTFAAKVATRLAERVVHGKPRPPKIPARPVNAALYALSRVEELLVGDLPLPFGSSLLAVGSAMRRPVENGR